MYSRYVSDSMASPTSKNETCMSSASSPDFIPRFWPSLTELNCLRVSLTPLLPSLASLSSSSALLFLVVTFEIDDTQALDVVLQLVEAVAAARGVADPITTRSTPPWPRPGR
jgi:hypothetical protein